MAEPLYRCLICNQPMILHETIPARGGHSDKSFVWRCPNCSPDIPEGSLGWTLMPNKGGLSQPRS